MEVDNFCKKILEIDGWKNTSDERKACWKTFSFSDFKQAFSFMTLIAMKAEQINHHPEWENIYNKVKITLITHDIREVSKLDYEMAIFAENCFKNYN